MLHFAVLVDQFVTNGAAADATAVCAVRVCMRSILQCLTGDLLPMLLLLQHLMV